MRLIVGLGNPGKKYQNNRHNAGYQFIDYIPTTCNLQFITSNTDKKLQVTSYKLQDVLLVKPLTFMNLTGQVIKKLVTSYELRVTNDLIIVHDDLDIPLGKFRIDFGRGPKLHGGITSIENCLKTKDFLRIRIGVDNRQLTGPANGEKYVLQNFRPEEKKTVEELFPKIWEKLEAQTIGRAIMIK